MFACYRVPPQNTTAEERAVIGSEKLCRLQGERVNAVVRDLLLTYVREVPEYRDVKVRESQVLAGGGYNYRQGDLAAVAFVLTLDDELFGIPCRKVDIVVLVDLDALPDRRYLEELIGLLGQVPSFHDRVLDWDRSTILS